MADYTDIVDPDSGAGYDYITFNACEAASETDHGAGAGDNLAWQCRASSGSDDTASVTISGNSVDSITVEGIDFPADGILDTSKYTMKPVDRFTSCIEDIADNNVTINHIQLVGTPTGAADGDNLINDISAIGIVIDSCIFYGEENSGFRAKNGIQLGSAGASVIIKNTLLYNFGIDGILDSFTAATAVIYNCTITRCDGDAIERNSGTFTATNCALFNNADDIDGTVTTTNCATDEGAGVGTAGVDISSTWDSTCFTDVNGLGPDWSVQDSDSPLYNVGADLSGSGVTDDIIDTARPQATTYDIGAFELPVGGVTQTVSGEFDMSGSLSRQASLKRSIGGSI